MPNKYLKDYVESKNNKQTNYEQILSKVEEMSKMNVFKSKFTRAIATTVAVLILIVGIPQVYAKIQWNIEFKEYQNRNYETGFGIIKDNEYTQNVDMDYIEQDGIKVKVDSLIITDDNFEATIDFQFDEDIQVNSETFTYGFAVYDDNKNVYGILTRKHSGEKYDKYIKCIYEDIGVKYNKRDIHAPQIQNACGIERIEATERKITTKIEMDSVKGFPKSNKLYIRVFDLGFDMYDFSDKENIICENFLVSNNEWMFEIDVPQKFYERLTTNLKLKEEIPGVDLSKIAITETGMIVTGTFDEINDIVLQGKDMPVSQWREKQNNLVYITDEKGNRYNNIRLGTYGGEKNSIHIEFDVTKKIFENSVLYFNYTNPNGNLYKTELIKE